MVDALSELCFLFFKGGNSIFIAALASGLSPKTTNIDDLDNYGPSGPTIRKIRSSYYYLIASWSLLPYSMTLSLADGDGKLHSETHF